MEKIMWLVLGGVALVAALRAGTSPRAMHVARAALATLFIVFGAAVNALYLAAGTGGYDTFADGSPIAFVRDTWQSVVVPNQGLYIGLLIAAEAAAGVLIALGGRWMQAGLVALIGFHLGMLTISWFLWLWALPMLLTFALLLRAERQSRTGRLTLHLPPRRVAAPA
ncbi:hypothetical protein [Georgenia yuyongxinii]|uniref:Uncharacterized protein n=1 Tax=Georgenia yuyongxinii TaxID=2589797 RepID=A0A552WUJ2_9MICO|nr:hypothetical protein [Georgenia yuyongxinii]TRW46229.1 hypothetical protein FJ693_06500 [Georgenia yuyongxinii]